MLQWTREKIDEMYAAIQRGDEMGIKPYMPHNTDKRLKPCPFCGCDDLNVEYTTIANMRELFFVRCYDCGISASWNYTKENVFKMWNTRVGEK